MSIDKSNYHLCVNINNEVERYGLQQKINTEMAVNSIRNLRRFIATGRGGLVVRIRRISFPVLFRALDGRRRFAALLLIMHRHREPSCY